MRGAVFLSKAILVVCTLFTAGVRADVIFSDNFNNGASPLWGNEVGNWTASGGVYFAQAPANNPATYTSPPFQLGDFSIDVDVNHLQDGGIRLHSSNDRNGVLLVTGGRLGTGTGLCLHIVQNGVYGSLLNGVTGLFTPGDSDAHIRVVVSGDTYSAYVDGASTPATSLTTNLFPTGRAALYDFSNQTFDNVLVATAPEPSALAPIGSGLAGLPRLRRKRNRARSMRKPVVPGS